MSGRTGRRTGHGQAAGGPAHTDPCPSPTRELPPARPNAVHEDDVALVAEPPHRPPHGGLGRGDRGGELGDGEGPGGEGGGHAPGDARAGEEVGRLRELGVRDRHRAVGREAEPERERGRPAPAVVLPVIGGDEELVGAGLLGAAELPGRAREVADEHGPVGARGPAGLVSGGLADVREDEPGGAPAAGPTPRARERGERRTCFGLPSFRIRVNR